MESLKIGQYFRASQKRAEFINKKSSQFENRYNNNPNFFQRLIDGDVEIEKETYSFPSHEMNIDFPWYGGYLHIVDGIAYVIDENFDGYCQLSFMENVLSPDHLTELMNDVISFLQAGYDLGFTAGEQAKQAEICKVLGV